MSNTTVDENIYTLINVFTVDPDEQQQLADTLVETIDHWLKDLPGFISATIYKSLDGTKVVNFSKARQEDKAMFDALASNPEIRERMHIATSLGKPEGHFYSIVRTIEQDN